LKVWNLNDVKILASHAPPGRADRLVDGHGIEQRLANILASQVVKLKLQLCFDGETQASLKGKSLDPAKCAVTRCHGSNYTRSHASGGIQWFSLPFHFTLQPMGLVSSTGGFL